MAKDWFEKNAWWIHWTIKILYPVAIFLGLTVGSYLISVFGIETKAHATETFVHKIDFTRDSLSRTKTEEQFKRFLVELNNRQKINRQSVVILNQKHNLPTPDYPVGE